MEAQLNLPPKQVPPERMTLEEFLQWTDEDVWAEWIDGEVRLLSPVNDPHVRLFIFLVSLLQHFVEHHNLGEIRTEPFTVNLSQINVVYSPDIFFVAQSRLHLLQTTYFDGAPDLVVEIVSPESRRRDRVEKFEIYEKAGVREYWLFEPERKTVDFYALDEHGIFELLPGENDVWRSKVLPGFWLKGEWLWSRPRPSLLSILREWGIIP